MPSYFLKENNLKTSFVISIGTHALILFLLVAAFGMHQQIRTHQSAKETLNVALMQAKQKRSQQENADAKLISNKATDGEIVHKAPSEESSPSKPTENTKVKKQPPKKQVYQKKQPEKRVIVTDLSSSWIIKQPKEKRVKKIIEKKDIKTVQDFMSNMEEISSVDAQIKTHIKKEAKRPRRKIITPKTKEHKFASYMEDWRVKMQNVGNRIYPQKAKDMGISGTVVLDVEIYADGSLKNIKILRSSGYEMLDEAAIKTVKVSAPFKEFTSSMRKDAEIVSIVRSWRYDSSVFK